MRPAMPFHPSDFRCAAEFELALQDVELMGFDIDDLLGRGDLRAQGSLGHGRCDHIGGETEIGGFELEAFELGLRGQ